jgi:hypothetical protein
MPLGIGFGLGFVASGRAPAEGSAEKASGRYGLARPALAPAGASACDDGTADDGAAGSAHATRRAGDSDAVAADERREVPSKIAPSIELGPALGGLSLCDDATLALWALPGRLAPAAVAGRDPSPNPATMDLIMPEANVISRSTGVRPNDSEGKSSAAAAWTLSPRPATALFARAFSLRSCHAEGRSS